MYQVPNMYLAWFTLNSHLIHTLLPTVMELSTATLISRLGSLSMFISPSRSWGRYTSMSRSGTLSRT